jgi:hypothetical protein
MSSVVSPPVVPLVATISYPVGTILRTYYVDSSPRYYKVVKETACKVKCVRLLHKFIKEPIFQNLPSDNEYPDGKFYIMTKKDGKLFYLQSEVVRYEL